MKMIKKYIESVRNKTVLDLSKPFFQLTLTTPLKEYVLYTLLKVDNYGRPLYYC